ncbi:phosphomannomutase/phosphoglucomutase [Thiohalomonas denitrificans]|uniref:phosphomannomutase n=1 Tax=Thiohalomonas denitrificans TaxID=415747 RepID=A0A1G5QKX6_9GAMM|nr:phosphomannomutase/phosphoglucomutase [Thiohalomonas denitrificans]SCZ61981.1 phosphomannomutase / phosphoglucomutase [Thiohalomonas denitrificans]
MTLELPETIFRTYDVRGVVGEGFDVPQVEAIGRALGSEARERGATRIALGRDGRLSGPRLMDAMAAGLQATGLEVLDLGCVPTPVLYFAAHTRTDGNGVMVTGSHNPPDYNGLKMMVGGETLSGDAITGLRRRFRENRLTSGRGGRRDVAVSEEYLQRIVSDISLRRRLKVVVDCGNGAAGVLAPELLRRLGCEVVELFCEVDGRFPNHHPDPSQPENLADLARTVARSGAHVGFAFDGDGDRLGVVTPEGKPVWPDRLMILFARDVLSRRPGAKIIYDVKCSGRLGDAVRAAGGTPEMWLTGHSLLKARLKATAAPLAGEMSGHFFFAERWYGFDDALYAAARLAEILTADIRSPSEVFAALPDAINTPELRVEMAEGEPQCFMEALSARTGMFAGAQLTTIDGVRADFADGWGLVRCSNTTPSLVLRFEADDASGLHRIQARFRQVMQDVQPGIELPF